MSSWERARNFAPALRVDVTFEPLDAQAVRIFEPASQLYLRLYRLEAHLAQQMDGQRNLAALTVIAQQYNRGVVRAHVERFVVHLNNASLLLPAEGSPPEDPELEAAPDALTWFAGGQETTVREPTLAVSGHAAEPRVDVAPPSASGESVMELAAEDATEDEEAAGEQDAAAPEQEGEDASAAATPADVAEKEQAQLWSEHTKKWHQSSWIRALVLLAVLAGIAALIPYPLRVSAECKIIPSERAQVRSEIQGVIAEILVDEGQLVKKGDVLARIDDRALTADRQKALAEIEKYEAELATLRQGRRPEEIQQQQAILASRRNEELFAAKEATRRRTMVKEGVGSIQDADAAQREYETARKAVAEADAALRLVKAGTRPEELAAQDAVLKRARAELAYIDQRLAMTVVRAPIDGEILTPRFRERVKEGVEAGGLVCEIANTRRVRAEILVPERDIDVVQNGMSATVKVDSFPTHPFEGKVNFIAPTVDGNRIRVVVELENPGGLLKANMTGYGEVEVGDRSVLNLVTRRLVRWIRVRFLI